VQLDYSDVVSQVGDASFTLKLDNTKVTEANVRNFNRIEIIEDGTVRWVGFILRKTISFDTVKVRCQSLIGILKKRLVGSSYTLNGAVDVQLQALLTAINATEDTGISYGDCDITTAINLTFSRNDVYNVITQIANAVDGEFIVGTDRKLYLKTNVGTDLSSSVVLEYDVNRVSAADILNFNVDDDGDKIVTTVYGSAPSYTSTQSDASLIAKFGLVEKSSSQSSANTQTDLDNLTAAVLQDTVYAPEMKLVPTVEDNFVIGDIVHIRIKNKLVDIEGDYKVLSKSVSIEGEQKLMTLKINELLKTLRMILRIYAIE
jgi:hypothetical protein